MIYKRRIGRMKIKKTIKVKCKESCIICEFKEDQLKEKNFY